MFHFKQFSLEQDNCAMKISTDACILGAYASVENATNILDIGTGTGVLTLMSAQRNPTATFYAVELEEKAFKQAKENFLNSPFASRIHIFHQTIQNFAKETTLRFDCIISNPPFFINSLPSQKHERTLARHTHSLSFDNLVELIALLLEDNGRAVILLPETEMKIFTQKAVLVGLFPQKKLVIYSHKGKAIFRVITTFSKVPCFSYPTEELVIYRSKQAHQTHSNYTDDFANLLRNYYLIF